LFNVNPRYLYGELRLGRLNWIYRLCFETVSITNLLRGYEYGYHEYSTFVQRNFAWLLTIIVYVTLVLLAMQVGLATQQLQHDDRFNRASYGFTVLSILALLISLIIFVFTLLVLVTFNGLYALWKRRETRAEYRGVFENNAIKKH
jgi:uncharacterized membrane protein YcjF (UPF0283 family)